MYTVIRFLATQGSGRIEDVATSLRSLFPDSEVEIDVGVPNRLSFSVSMDPNWEKHRDAIFQCVVHCADLLRFSREAAIEVEIDLALEPEDYQDSLVSDIGAWQIFRERLL